MAAPARRPGASGPAQLFAAALVGLEEELDWTLLGELHCWEGGAGFFPAEQRAALREAGLLFAADVAEWVPRGGPGRSLYLGAALAELAPILCERLVLEREVVALSLPGAQTAELNRALAVVGAALGRELARIDTVPLGELEGEPCDHAWMTSVLTDPEAFPALHDELYGRRAELATGRGDLAAEREQAGSLVAALLERLRPPCLLTTTDEELALVAPACAARGWRLAVPASARLSAVVGDPVRHCRVSLESVEESTG